AQVEGHGGLDFAAVNAQLQGGDAEFATADGRRQAQGADGGVRQDQGVQSQVDRAPAAVEQGEQPGQGGEQGFLPGGGGGFLAFGCLRVAFRSQIVIQVDVVPLQGQGEGAEIRQAQAHIPLQGGVIQCDGEPVQAEKVTD